MADREAGDRLARVLRVAMAQAGIATWAQLGIESGVSPTTIDNWIYGMTTPRSAQLAKVAMKLHPYCSVSELERAYFNLPATEPPLLDVLRDLVPELRELVVVLRAQADEEILLAVREALAQRRQSIPGLIGVRHDGSAMESQA